MNYADLRNIYADEFGDSLPEDSRNINEAQMKKITHYGLIYDCENDDLKKIFQMSENCPCTTCACASRDGFSPFCSKYRRKPVSVFCDGNDCEHYKANSI